MQVDRLGNYIKIISGFPFKSELFNEEGVGLPLIRVRDVNSGFAGIYYSGEYPNEYVIVNGDILIGMDGDFNAIVWKHGDALLNQRVCKLVVDDRKLSKSYVLQYLPQALKDIHRKTTFTTVKHLSNKSIEAIQIPLPDSIADQIRIAAVLSRAEKLIARRKASIKALDELLKSTFLEMFGDPVRNEKGWEKKSGDRIIIDIIAGVSYGGDEKSSLEEDELGVLKISAVTAGVFNPKEFKAVKKDTITKNVPMLCKGDFIMSRANTFELIAACCVIPQEYPSLFLPDKLWRVEFDSKRINIQYANHLLKNENFRNTVRKEASGGHDSMLNISMKKFKQLDFAIPPLPLQNQFAAIVEKVELLKARSAESLTELENLYGALSQRAFKGELDLSRMPAAVE